jgi:hypothetical protein
MFVGKECSEEGVGVLVPGWPSGCKNMHVFIFSAFGGMTDMCKVWEELKVHGNQEDSILSAIQAK